MQNKLPYLLTLTLALAAVLFLDTQAQAQSQRYELKTKKQERDQIRRDNRQERIIVRPNVQVVRPARTRSAVNIYRNDNYSGNERYLENNAYGSFAQVARINGYQDGLKEGLKDARDGDRYDPFAESDYKNGTGGFRSSYGDKEAYKQFYRQAFLRGYRESFSRYLGGSRDFNW